MQNYCAPPRRAWRHTLSGRAQSRPVTTYGGAPGTSLRRMNKGDSAIACAACYDLIELCQGTFTELVDTMYPGTNLSCALSAAAEFLEKLLPEGRDCMTGHAGASY